MSLPARQSRSLLLGCLFSSHLLRTVVSTDGFEIRTHLRDWSTLNSSPTAECQKKKCNEKTVVLLIERLASKTRRSFINRLIDSERYTTKPRAFISFYNYLAIARSTLDRSRGFQNSSARFGNRRERKPVRDRCRIHKNSFFARMLFCDDTFASALFRQLVLRSDVLRAHRSCPLGNKKHYPGTDRLFGASCRYCCEKLVKYNILSRDSIIPLRAARNGTFEGDGTELLYRHKHSFCRCN